MTKATSKQKIKYPLLLSIQAKLDLPMLILSFVWLGVLITELVYGSNVELHFVGSSIWIFFILYVGLRFLTAEDRWAFLKKNWLFVLAIVAAVMRFFPFLQEIPIARILTATFGMQVIWIFTSADQGMRSLRRKLGQRGSGYVIVFTFVFVLVSAAGMLHFENLPNEPDGLKTYPRALWWTAMQMTNIGSAYSIRSDGGRVICLAISIYAAAMFGYLTALIASFFIDRSIKDPKIEIAHQKKVQDLQDEIVRLTRLMEHANPSSISKAIKVTKRSKRNGAKSHELE